MSGEGHDNGNDKKSRERERFEAALRVLRRQNDYGRAVSQQVFGAILEAGESPDFIVSMPSRANHCIGVEHFHVDTSGEPIRNRRGSGEPGVRSRLKSVVSKQNRLQERGKHIDWSDHNQMVGIKDGLVDLLTGYAQIQFQTDYLELSRNFSIILDKHLGKVDSYLENIRLHSDAMQPRHECGGLVFYIELQCDYSSLILNQPGRPPRRFKPGELPMFPEIVELLHKIAKCHVDWILLSTAPMIVGGMVGAYLMDLTDLEGSMNKQQLVLCRHFTSQMHEPFDANRPFVLSSGVNAENDIDFKFSTKRRRGPKRKLRHLIETEVCKALDAAEGHETYATTLDVQTLLDTYGEYLLKCKRPGVSLTPGVMERLLGWKR
jgi:hypothetical protein